LSGGAGAQAAAAGGHPDFSGLWRCAQHCGNGELLPGDKLQMTPEAQRLYATKKAAVDKGDRTVDTALACHPLGLPRLAMFGTFEIFQSPERMGVIGEWVGPGRIMYFTNTHRKGIFPTFMGDGIARWEGNTLVIDTVNFEEQTLLDSSGFPHSDQFHFVERWNLSADGKTITSDWTIEDPKMFKVPFTKQVVYARKDAADETQRLVEDVCQNVEDNGHLVK
jgi:hypothetical protein